MAITLLHDDDGPVDTDFAQSIAVIASHTMQDLTIAWLVVLERPRCRFV